MSTTLAVGVEIFAPISTVWNLLSNFEGYARWNQFTPKVYCSKNVGDPVIIHAFLGNSKKAIITHLTLNTFEDGQCVCWGADRLWLTVNRCQTLTSISPNKTKYYNSELFAGILAPIVMLTQKKKLMRGYQLAALGLKNEAEKIHNSN